MPLPLQGMGAGKTVTTLELDLPRPEPRRDRYGRYLIKPADGGKARAYTRATTWAKALDDQSSLINWSMRMCALGLITRKDLYAQVAACRPDDRDALSRLVDQAKEAGGGSEGANLGSALHAFTERIDLGEMVDVPDLWRPDVDAYIRAIAEHSLIVRRDLVERVVVLEELGVAGTLDRVYRTPDNRLVIGDVKTGQTLDFNRLAISIQLAIYANADTLYDPATETHAPMVDVDKSTALVVHLPSGQGRCEIHEVNIATGWRYASLAGDVRAARAHGRRTSGDCLFQSYSYAAPETPTAPPADPYREWIVARLDVIRGHPEAARTMAGNWPDGVPGLKTDHRHTVAELDRIAEIIDTVEATFGIPFGDPDPRVPKPSGPPAVPIPPAKAGGPDVIPDEGPDVDPTAVAEIIERIDALPEQTRKQLNAWAAGAHKVGRAFSIKARPSLRRYRIYEACLALAEFDGWTEAVAASLAGVIPNAIRPETPSIGAAIGGLTADQAVQLVAVVQTAKQGQPALIYSEDGAVRWDLTTSNTTDKEHSTS